MQRFKSHWFVGLLVAAVVGTAVFVPGVSLAQNDQAVISPQPLSAEEAVKVEAFWTPQRMSQAIPKPIPLRDISEKQPVPSGTFTPSGPMIKVNSGRPGDQITQQSFPATTQKIVGTAERANIQPLYSGGSPFPFTRYRVFPDQKGKTYQSFPYNLIGKIYFRGSDGYLYVASASVVAAANFSVVWTAGHCVYTNALVDPYHVGFNSLWVFLPGEYQGTTKYKVWPAYVGVTSQGWENNHWEYDVGALVLLPSKKGPIGLILGWLGIMFNDYYLQNWTLVGYPAQVQSGGPPGLPFDGEHQEVCGATFGEYDMGSGGPYTIGVGCDQTPGCSGGPWIVDFSGVAGTNNYVNGNFSYRYISGPLASPLTIYSPYFGDAAYNVWNSAQTIIP